MQIIKPCLISILISVVTADNWAVLVAGSNGFWNYRHQSDTCHAYQILIQNGYKPENIITFSYDDIPNNFNNPFPGQLFNKPSYDGDTPVDVRNGCVIDYVGKEVTPANYLAVLRGDSAFVNGKKVLQSNKNDRVFLNFADHGAPGILAFPNGYLFAKDLITTFDQMYQKGLYGQMIYYLEACESGSMFLDLKPNSGIYGLSAADPTESSWAYYCPPQDRVFGQYIGTCLGDHFSINWMEDIESGNLDRSLRDHFELIKSLTDDSHVMQWGDLSFNDDPVSNFLADRPSEVGFLSKIRNIIRNKQQSKDTYTKWNSRDVKFLYLINRFKQTQSEIDLIALLEEYNERQYFDKKFYKLKDLLQLTGEYTKAINGDCLEQQINNFENACIKFSDYGLKYVKYIAEMCDRKGLLLQTMVNAINQVCL